MIQDDIYVKKIYQDQDLIEIEVKFISKYAIVWQTCYLDSKNIEKYTTMLEEFVIQKQERCYLEFGSKKGRYTPAFSLCLEDYSFNKVRIEVDMEIDDNQDRKHRASFYMYGTINDITKFTSNFKRIKVESVGYNFNLLT